MNWLEIEMTLKMLEEAKKSGEEVEIQCPVAVCDECPYSEYCK